MNPQLALIRFVFPLALYVGRPERRGIVQTDEGTPGARPLAPTARVDTESCSDGSDAAVDTVPPFTQPNALHTTVSRVRDVMLDEEEYDEEFAQPTWEAFSAVVRALTGAALVLSEQFPVGRAAADGEGGLRVSWADGERNVRLVCPGSSPSAGYVYHEAGGDYGGEFDISGETLAGSLEWLQQG